MCEFVEHTAMPSGIFHMFFHRQFFVQEYSKQNPGPDQQLPSQRKGNVRISPFQPYIWLGRLYFLVRDLNYYKLGFSNSDVIADIFLVGSNQFFLRKENFNNNNAVQQSGLL